MEEKIFMTQEGLEKTKQRLDFLKSVKRHEVAEKIAEARSYGDLSENSEYDLAREEQASVEAEIFELENKLYGCNSDTCNYCYGGSKEKESEEYQNYDGKPKKCKEKSESKDKHQEPTLQDVLDELEVVNELVAVARLIGIL